MSGEGLTAMDPNIDREVTLSRMGQATLRNDAADAIMSDTLTDCSGATIDTREPVPAKPTLPNLSFADAKRAGEAMYDRWHAMAKADNEGDVPCGPPFARDDAAWSDMFRAGFEAVRWGK